MFPILWLVSWHNNGPVSEQAYFVMHGILDIVCKSGYGICMTYYRMTLEDFFIDKYANGDAADGGSDESGFPMQHASVKIDLAQIRRK